MLVTLYKNLLQLGYELKRAVAYVKKHFHNGDVGMSRWIRLLAAFCV